MNAIQIAILVVLVINLLVLVVALIGEFDRLRTREALRKALKDERAAVQGVLDVLEEANRLY